MILVEMISKWSSMTQQGTETGALVLSTSSIFGQSTCTEYNRKYMHSPICMGNKRSKKIEFLAENRNWLVWLSSQKAEILETVDDI